MLLGMDVKVDPSMPDDEVRLVDPKTGDVLVRLVNVALPEPESRIPDAPWRVSGRQRKGGRKP